MAEAIERDVRLIEDTLQKTRTHQLMNMGLAALILTWFGVTLKPLATTWGKVEAAIIIVVALQFVFAVRAWVRIRKGGRAAKALVGTGTIAEVNGWPAIKKLPEGKYQGYLHVVATDGSKATLRVEPARIRAVCEALHRESPAAVFRVVNVLVGVKTDAEAVAP